MNELRLWAADLSLVLIVTGILMKVVPEKNERKILRFVVTLLLIISVFNINISDSGMFVQTDIANEISEKTNEMNDDILTVLNEESIKIARNKACEIIRSVIPSADADITFSHEGLHAVISCENFSSYELDTIKTELKKEFDCEIILKAEGKRKNE